MFRRSSSPRALTTSPRLGAGTSFQVWKASWLRARMPSNSAGVTLVTVARASPLIGETTVWAFPLPVQAPPNPPAFTSSMPSDLRISRMVYPLGHL